MAIDKNKNVVFVSEAQAAARVHYDTRAERREKKPLDPTKYDSDGRRLPGLTTLRLRQEARHG